MIKAKRIMSIFLVVLMLFTSLPMNVFAEEITSDLAEESSAQEVTTAVEEETTEEATTTEEVTTTEETTATEEVTTTEEITTTEEVTTTEEESEPVYEDFSTYTIDGVVYHTQAYYAEVVGAGENMPADVVIPERIGTFPVQKILAGAFDNCKELKSIVIPKYVRSIAGLKNTGLEKAEILGSAIDIRFGAFRDCPLFENEENWKDGLLIISNALIAGSGCEELYLGKEITSIAMGCFGADSQIPKITFENLKFCFQTISSDTFGENTVLKGRVGSDAQRYANSYGNPFEYYCTCENQQTVKETKSYCNGTVGYSEGVWCENCGVWLSGHKQIREIIHSDENDDSICDYCGLSTEEKIIDAKAISDTVFWCQKEDGTVWFYGTGKLKSDAGNFHKFKNIIIGGEISEIDRNAFWTNSHLESVVISENVKIIGQSAFAACDNLKKVEILGEYIEIKARAFGDTAFIADEANYKDGLLVVSGCLINCNKWGYAVLDKSIHSIAADGLYGNNRVVIENPDCVISSTGKVAFSVMGLEGSTAEKYALDNDLTFYRLCLCEDVPVIEGEPSLCDGTLNYKDGQWCEKCNTWKLGYGISSEIKHSETLVDGVCTVCGEAVPESNKIIDSGVIENGVWVLQNEDELVIYGTGEIKSPKDEQDYAGWHNLKQQGKVKRIRVKGTVSKIGNDLFNGMTSVESVKLENGVTEIGDSAFYGCKNLVNIELSNILISVGNSAFENCKLLQVPVFPDTLYSIGDRAFAECDAFVSLMLPDNAEYIGDYAFTGCSNLTYVKLSKKAARCGEYVFYNCLKLKTADLAGFSIVREGAFEKCTALETVTSSDRFIYVYDYSFAYCSSLKNIPWDKVRSIGENAFLKCTSLTEVNLDCSGRVDDFAFNNCTRLKKVTMSARTDDFGVGVFQSCTDLEDVALSTGLTEIPKQMFKCCRALKAIEIPSNITTIGIAAFRECTGLTEIVLGESISQIKVKAFYGCTKLESITFLNNDVSIAGVYTEDGKKYPSIPKSTVICAAAGSNAHSFALKNGYAFKSTDVSSEPVRIEIVTQPTKTKYYVSDKSSKIDTSGIVLRVYFGNETYIDLTSGFTVDAKDTDLTKVGTYNPAIIYKGLEAVFTVTVEEKAPEEEEPETPPAEENKTLDFVEGSALSFRSSEYDTIRFVPKETRVYYFVLENANSATIQMPDGSKVRSSSDMFRYSFTAGETYLITYSLRDYYLTLRETDMYDSEILSDGTVRIRRHIGAVENFVVPSEFNGRTVTEIGDGIFSYNDSIKSIKIPSTVKSIGKQAFLYCDNLTDIDLSEATSLEYIGEGAFKYCDGLKEITLPSSVKEIGSEAFESCELLETVVFGENDITFGEQVFYYCKKLKNVTLPENLTALSDDMFWACTSLEKIKLNEGLKKIGNQAFLSCTSLEGIVLPNSLEEIDERAFRNCESIKEIVVPEKVTTISKYLFSDCDSLEKVYIKGENAVIGEEAFERCRVLKEIIFENSVSEIGRWAFWHCESLESIDLGDSLSKIDSWAFEECTALKEITLPESLTEIGSSVFTGCSSLKKATILGEVTSIGYGYFKDCTSLESVNIPKSVTKIGDGAFENTKICIESLEFSSPVEIGKTAFKGCTEIKSLSVPENSSIGVGAFEDNTGLLEATVGKNSTIYGSAFKGCLSLKEFEVTEGTEMLANALDDCRNLKKITIRNPMVPKYSLGTLPLNIEVYAIKGSYGESFAKDNNFKFFEIDGHAHSFAVRIEGENKCYTSGKEIYTCECGYSYEKAISGTSHKYTDFVTEKEPTCTEPGIKTRHCYCGKTRSEITVIPALGHTEIIDIPAVAPTSTEPGYTHQSHCSVCGETVVKRELIGHGEYDIKFDNDVVTAEKFDAATNENDGVSITITFELKNQVYLSYIDKTVICKVGEVKLSKTEFAYNGKVQKPTVTVKDSTGEPLVLNRDYRVTYSADSKYSGKYSVRVDYIGNYAGSKTLWYDIVIGAVVPTVSSSTEKSITLSWNKVNSDLAYCVYSADSKGNLNKIADTENGNYTVSSLKSGTEYRYLVRAYVKDGKGKIYWGDKGSSVLCATAPAKTSKLSVSSETKSVKLSWSKVSGATGYRVYKYDGSWKMVRDTTALSCEVSKLKSGTAYKFYVRPYKQFSGKTVWSADNKADAVQTYTKPSATSEISYTSSTDSVKLSWGKVTGATGYRIYLYDNSKDKYAKVADTAKNSYTVKKKNGKKLKSGVEYKFRVKAYIKKNGKTYWSDSYKTIRTATKPAKTTLTATSSKGKVNLSWKNVEGESGYQVYYATKKNGKYKKLTSTKANKVKYSKKLTKGKKYYFKVRAFKKVGSKTVYGSFSSAKSVKIK